MDIIIQSLGFKASSSLEEQVKQKLQTLKDDHIIRANVILYKGSSADPENNYCEIRLEIPGNDPFVKKQSPHFETSVSECVNILAKQLNKIKEKNSSRNQLQTDTVLEIIDDNDLDEEL